MKLMLKDVGGFPVENRDRGCYHKNRVSIGSGMTGLGYYCRNTNQALSVSIKRTYTRKKRRPTKTTNDCPAAEQGHVKHCKICSVHKP